MKTLMVKTHYDGPPTLADPKAPLGDRPGGISIRRITGIPDDVSASAVLVLYNTTADIRWVYQPEGAPPTPGQYELRYSQLGHGKIIR